jgi:hypothetical protein
VSCPSAGNCAAVGTFSTGQAFWAFVISEVDGAWRPATPVRGLPHGAHSDVVLNAISCPARGNCTAVGRVGWSEGFAVSEVNGVWRTAEMIPGLTRLDLVSCAAPGNCSAAGYRTGGLGPYVVSQVDGAWGTARPLPGASMLYHRIGWYPMTALSCASPGNCVAAGAYQNRSQRCPLYVVSQVHGFWRAPIRIPGMAALGPADFCLHIDVTSVSCPSPGNCAVGGAYPTGHGSHWPFVVSEVNGAWRAAAPVPGLNHPGSFSEVTSVSCQSAGNCTAAGTAPGFGSGGFVVSEVGGTWRAAVALRAPATPGQHRWLMRSALLSCAAPGTCAVAGYFGDPGVNYPYVVTEVDGTWGTARVDPNARIFTKTRDVRFAALSCAPHGDCVAGGSFGTGHMPLPQGGQYTKAFLLTIG